MNFTMKKERSLIKLLSFFICTKQMIRFDSPLPDDMQSLIDKWHNYSENMTQFLEE